MRTWVKSDVACLNTNDTATLSGTGKAQAQLATAQQQLADLQANKTDRGVVVISSEHPRRTILRFAHWSIDR